MKINYILVIIIIMLALIQPSYAATSSNTVPQQFQQLIQKVTEFQQQIQEYNSNNMVMLGNQYNDMQNAEQYFAYITMRLIDVASKLSTYQTLQKQIDLKWQALTLTDASIKDAFVAGMVNEKPVTICRGQFLGADVNSTASYPGELTDHGCRISYAGYAFTVSKYDVLVGKGTNLQWLPFEQVLQMYALQNLGSLVIYGDMQYPLYKLQPQINKPLPVAGGEQGGHAVYICRTTYNNQLKIGKLVTFIGVHGILTQACDIGVDNKEIPVMQNFELLLTKPEQIKSVPSSKS